LLRGFGWLDGSLHGDVAVRRGIRLLDSPEQNPAKPGAKLADRVSGALSGCASVGNLKRRAPTTASWELLQASQLNKP
jgi:hypothetical protein